MVCTEEALFTQDHDHSVVKGGVEFPSGDAWIQAWAEHPRFCLDKLGKSI